MPQRDKMRILLNDREIAVPDVGAARTLLDFLRIERRLTGTKEGCAEGDCGACTVLVGRLEGGTLRYEPVNACIRFLASVDGYHVVTVEHLAGTDGALNPVQRAMVAEHGSQCGFCTPGIVMALYALWMQVPEPDEAQIETALQGNLCRCTGYAPIIRAAQAASRYGPPAADRLSRDRTRVTAALVALRDGARVVTGPEEDRAILPADLDDFAEILADTSNATIVAGATDFGLWVTKFLRTHAPSTYKIPLASDRPRIFNVALADWSQNAERTIKRSRAVGEPPFMLGISVSEALSMAVASVDDYRTCPRLDAPATPERVLMAVERLRGIAP